MSQATFMDHIIAGIGEKGLCEFTIERVYDTLFGEFEFNAALRRTRRGMFKGRAPASGCFDGFCKREYSPT